MLIGCGILIALAVAADAPTLGAIAAVLLTATLIYDVGGWRLFRALLPAWVLLWLVIPLPFGGDERLVHGLQAIASRCASPLLDVLGIYHIPSGNVVDVGPAKRYFVEQACSGIQSLLPILAVTLFGIFWLRRPIIHGVLLLLAAVGWVLAVNAVRITTVVYAGAKWNIDIATNWKHEALGMVLFAVALALVYSTDQLLLFFSKPRSALGTEPETETAEQPTSCPQLAQCCFLSSWTVAAFGVLGLAQTLVMWPGEMPPATAITERFDTLPEPESVLQPLLEMNDFKAFKSPEFDRKTAGQTNMDAKNSYLWRYRDQGNLIQVELDYVYDGWHDLTVCYRGTGWDVLDRKRQPASKDDGPGEHGLMEAQLLRPVNLHGWLLWSMIDQNGQLVNPPRINLVGGLVDRLANRQWTLGGTRQGSRALPTYQVQLLVQGNRPLNDEDKKTYESFFWHVREVLRKHGPRDDKAAR